MSKIEEKIASIFRASDIKYIREKNFADLKKGLLRYDFYLPDLQILCEVDSMLHFKLIPKFHKNRHEFMHA